LSGNDKKAYETLRNRFPEGAKAVDWRKATGLPESTFFRVVGNLTRITSARIRRPITTKHFRRTLTRVMRMPKILSHTPTP